MQQKSVAMDFPLVVKPGACACNVHSVHAAANVLVPVPLAGPMAGPISPMAGPMAGWPATVLDLQKEAATFGGTTLVQRPAEQPAAEGG